MLLRFQAIVRSSADCLRLTLLIWGMTAGVSCATWSKPSCYVELPVYDANGNRLPFEVVSVARLLDGAPLKGNLLEATGKDRLIRVGTRLYFSKARLENGYEVTLHNGRGTRIRRNVELSDCAQRISLQYLSQDTDVDAVATVLLGRIAGCELRGDWWIMITPMFGGHWGPVNFEAGVDLKDGSFLLNASLSGDRQILVIGKGRDPVRAIGINVIKAGLNDLGTVQLEGLCPK